MIFLLIKRQTGSWEKSITLSEYVFLLFYCLFILVSFWPEGILFHNFKEMELQNGKRICESNEKLCFNDLMDFYKSPLLGLWWKWDWNACGRICLKIFETIFVLKVQSAQHHLKTRLSKLFKCRNYQAIFY